MATVSQWVAGARPRTLPAAIAPVAVGTGAAIGDHGFRPVIAVLALLLALWLQIGVNYANDYSDGVKGTDEVRVGPVRLVGQGLAPARSVKLAALGSLALGALCGLTLVMLSQVWWLLPVGVVSVLAAWWYTGGPKPYGYLGLGELFVFVFFGLVAVVGTYAAQTGTVATYVVIAAAIPGLWSVAILLANNIRDIPTDKENGKITLAVRLGNARSRRAFAAAVGVPFILVFALGTHTTWALLGLAALPLAIRPVQNVLAGATGPSLIPVLGSTARLLLVGSVALGIGLGLGAL